MFLRSNTSQRGMDDYAEGMPLRFKNARYREYEGFDPNAAHLSWNNNTSHAALPNKSLIDAEGPTTGAVLNPNLGSGLNNTFLGQ